MSDAKSSATGGEGPREFGAAGPHPDAAPPAKAARLRQLLSRAAYTLVMLALAAATVKIYDIHLLKKAAPTPVGNMIPGAAEEGPDTSMQLYPYTGLHVHAHCRITSMDLMGRQLTGLDIRTGDCGFFINFDLQSPPKKAKDEFRVILIGGSAAQGFGGTSNEDMFYTRLENKLNAALGPGGTTVRVINMAMAGSITYQNYIALNRWGHGLEGDMILSFSGHNDLAIPAHVQDTDIPFCFKLCMGYVEASKAANSGPVLKWLSGQLPGLFDHTQLGSAVRVLGLDEQTAAAIERYRQSGACGDMVGAKLYVHALKSIKRDFEGIPMMVVFQPTAAPPAEHIPLVHAAEAELKGDTNKGYMNEDWYLVNLQKTWTDQGLFAQSPPLLVDGVHLSSAGHEVVARMLADELMPVIKTLRARKQGEAAASGTKD